MMKRMILIAALSFAVAFHLSAVTPDWIAGAFATAEQQSAAMFANVEKTGRLPRSIARGFCAPADWTAGFFPGQLWMLYGYTGKPEWKERAEKSCRLLEGQQFDASNHDLGFKMQCSFGRGYTATRKPEYAAILERSARTLASRFTTGTGLIQSWEAEPKRDWRYPVIIDNMMNLELLMEAYKQCGDSMLRHVAVSHADRTMKCQYRADMSCPHVVDYDPATGAVRKFDWNNGSDDTEHSTWARGQSWGLYGFTMMYRETGYERYLRHAERIADFLLAHHGMPEDMIPYWDYTGASRSTMRDASAAAIMASALLELSCYSDNSDRYFKAAEKQLSTLASPEYLAKAGENSDFLIKHATGNYLRNSELDGALSYADYYFLEGLLRYLRITGNKPLFDQIIPGIDTDRWFVEAHSPETKFTTRGDTLEVSTPKGLTLWYRPRLTGDYEITYNACMPMQGDPNARLSDLNCFWGANDPEHPDNLFSRCVYRRGIFQRYKPLTLFYVGYGGNYNSTTRFRQYLSGCPDQPDEEVRPVIKEYLDPEHLLKPGKWYGIRIQVKKNVARFYVNGELLFTRKLKPGEADGNFGLRLLENHVIITDFKVKEG